MNRLKARIRFRKAGDLRFLSHHDLMRLFERMLRRASLPFRNTEGFHPMPKMAFASALALGIVGHEEVVEIEFEDTVTVEEVWARLREQVRPGLEILSARAVDSRRSAQVVRAAYRLDFDAHACPLLPERCAALLGQNELWVERVRHGAGANRGVAPGPEDGEDAPAPRPAPVQKRRVNIRPYLLDVRPADAGLEICLAVTPTGAARPEEILRLLELEPRLDAGAVLERTRLELADETESSDPASSSERPSDVIVQEGSVSRA
jgi:radical SAM-linked protein